MVSILLSFCAVSFSVFRLSEPMSLLVFLSVGPSRCRTKSASLGANLIKCKLRCLPQFCDMVRNFLFLKYE